MKTIAEQLYGNSSYYDYQPIVEYLGNPIIQVDDDDYQGDTRVLLRKNLHYGILIFGWGSCSGCDALQACVSFEDVDELIEQLESSIKWFTSKKEVHEYVSTKDWELDYSWRSAETKDFVKQVLEWTQTI